MIRPEIPPVRRACVDCNGSGVLPVNPSRSEHGVWDADRFYVCRSCEGTGEKGVR